MLASAVAAASTVAYNSSADSGTRGLTLSSANDEASATFRGGKLGFYRKVEVICSRFLYFWYFCVFLPILLVLNGFIPSDWHRMNPTYLLKRLELYGVAGWSLIFIMIEIIVRMIVCIIKFIGIW